MFGKKIIPCVKVINGKTAEGPVYCGQRGAGIAVGKVGDRTDEIVLDAYRFPAESAFVFQRAAEKFYQILYTTAHL